jgi:hypothetical protein
LPNPDYLKRLLVAVGITHVCQVWRCPVSVGRSNSIWRPFNGLREAHGHPPCDRRGCLTDASTGSCLAILRRFHARSNIGSLGFAWSFAACVQCHRNAGITNWITMSG